VVAKLTVEDFQRKFDTRFGKAKAKVVRVDAGVSVVFNGKTYTIGLRSIYDRSRSKTLEDFLDPTHHYKKRSLSCTSEYTRFLRERFGPDLKWLGGDDYELSYKGDKFTLTRHRATLQNNIRDFASLVKSVLNEQKGLSPAAKFPTLKSWEDFVLNVTEGRVTPVTPYFGRKRARSHAFRCLACGDEWFGTFNGLLKPKCLSCDGLRARGFSKSQLRWLRTLEHKYGLSIIHAGNSKSEKRLTLEGKRLRVDGFCKELNLVLEFYGDVFHGCPWTTKPRDKCHPFDKSVTAATLYRKTLDKERKIKEGGYRLATIWQSEFKDKTKSRSWLKAFERNLKKWKKH
jgi:hypothetical protein